MQDPYSFRCQPQVMGACLDLMRNAARTLEIEANAVTDNPLLFGDDDACPAAISTPSRSPSPPTSWRMALCEIGSISERRTAVLVDPKMSGLPPFLIARQRASIRAS